MAQNFPVKLWQIQFDLRYEEIVLMVMTSQDDLKVDPIYSCLGEVGSGCKLHLQCLVNKCEYRNRLFRLNMPKEDRNK